MIRTWSRRAALFGPVLMTLVLAAQPAAAATGIQKTGLYGPYVINDDSDHRGAHCTYETSKTNGLYLLDDISVRAPTLYARDRGAGNQSQWLGWRYKIQRDGDYDGSYSTLYTSPVVKDYASETTKADFKRRYWTAPESVPGGNYRVKVMLIWYKPGSKTEEQGRVTGNMKYYHAEKGSSDQIRMYSCNRAY